jgi:hypothetical protein
VARYLRSLAPVKSVYATEVDTQWVRFHLEMTGDKNDLRRIIALGKTLLPDTPPIQPVVETPQPLPNGEGQQPVVPRLPQLPVNMLTYRLNG